MGAVGAKLPGVMSGRFAKHTSDEQSIRVLPLKGQTTGEVNSDLQIQGSNFKKYL